MKNLGVIVVLLAALVLIVPSLAGFVSNTTLAVGGFLLIAGIIIHVVMMKIGIDKEAKEDK